MLIITFITALADAKPIEKLRCADNWYCEKMCDLAYPRDENTVVACLNEDEACEKIVASGKNVREYAVCVDKIIN